MRKALLIISAFAFMSSLIFGAYAQTVQKPDPISLTEINTYTITPVETGKAALTPSTKLDLGSESYADTPVEKMGVGVINTTTSWTDIPEKVAEVSEKDNVLLGVTLGLGEGIISGFTRGASGVADIATFGLPPYDKPAVAPQYKNDGNQNFKVDLLKW